MFRCPAFYHKYRERVLLAISAPEKERNGEQLTGALGTNTMKDCATLIYIPYELLKSVMPFSE